MSIWNTIRRPITYPSDVDHARNGLLKPNELRQSMAPGYGMISLHRLASRAYDALQFIAWVETKQQLTVTSQADAYRNYQRQESTFLIRYLRTFVPLICLLATKIWNGVTWWQKRGYAMAAVPGTSNHGLGLAFDAALWVEVSKGKWKIMPVGRNKQFFAWLEKNALDFGFAWNNKTENWHLEYFAGDNVPQRVLDVEALLGIQV